MTNRIRPGDPQLSADHLNRQSDFSADVLSGRVPAGSFRHGVHYNSAGHYQNQDPDVVNIRNDTGCEIEQFQIVGLDRIASDEDEPVYGSSIPNGCRHAGQFAVALESIQPNSFGRAVFSGYTPSLIPEAGTGSLDVAGNDPGFASGESGLASNEFGSMDVLWGAPRLTETGAWIGGTRIRNAYTSLVSKQQDACGCASRGCEYECQEDSGEYGWEVVRSNCQSRYESRRDPSESELCDCRDPDTVSATRFPCNSGSVGHRMTLGCQGISAASQSVTITVDEDIDCESTCVWRKPLDGKEWILVEGCQSPCSMGCNCLHPDMANVGTSADEAVMPCIKTGDRGACVFRALSSRWEKVFDNCSRACPCPDPEDDYSAYPPGEIFVTDCGSSRCTPCYPEGFCRWRHNLVNGRSQWTFVTSQCGPYCECRSEPPYAESLSALSYIAPYDDGEIVTVGCCKSPIGLCDPTSTTQVPPTTSLPPTTSPTTGNPSTSSTTTSTTTTPAPTSGCPTVSPRLDPHYSHKTRPLHEVQGLLNAIPCHVYCYHSCPEYVTQSGSSFACAVRPGSLRAFDLGYPRGSFGALCSPRRTGVDRVICVPDQLCNSSTVGTVIPGTCHYIDEYAIEPPITFPASSGNGTTC